MPDLRRCFRCRTYFKTAALKRYCERCEAVIGRGPDCSVDRQNRNKLERPR